jgi:hypothetical protein
LSLNWFLIFSLFYFWISPTITRMVCKSNLVVIQDYLHQ